jgi:hypothetical protein
MYNWPYCVVYSGSPLTFVNGRYETLEMFIKFDLRSDAAPFTLECSYRLLSTKYCNIATEQSFCCGDSVHMADVGYYRVVLFEFNTIWSAGGRHFLCVAVVDQSYYLFVVHVELTKAVLSPIFKSRIVFWAKCVGNAYVCSSFRLQHAKGGDSFLQSEF